MVYRDDLIDNLLIEGQLNMTNAVPTFGTISYFPPSSENHNKFDANCISIDFLEFL